jgi:hypothetical protein
LIVDGAGGVLLSRRCPHRRPGVSAARTLPKLKSPPCEDARETSTPFAACTLAASRKALAKPPRASRHGWPGESRTHGNSCRRRANSSLRRVSFFSACSSSSRAVSHCSRVPVLCVVIVFLPSVGCPRFSEMTWSLVIMSRSRAPPPRKQSSVVT